MCVTSVQFPCNQQYVMCVWTSEYFLRQVCVCYVRNAWKIYWQILLKWCWPSHSCNRKDIVLLIIFLQVAYLTRSKWTESPHIDISEVKFPASVSDIWFTTSGLFLSAFLHGCWYLFLCGQNIRTANEHKRTLSLDALLLAEWLSCMQTIPVALGCRV